MTNAKNKTRQRLAAAVSAFLCASFLFSLTALFLSAPSSNVSAISSRDAATPEDAELATDKIQAAYLYNIENDFAALSYRVDEVVYPTSTVKIMVGIIAIEQLGNNLDEVITVTEDMLRDVSGNSVGFEVGEELTVESLLYALLVGGANDAAAILAVRIAGSVSDFVVMMNERAEELGAKSTHYTNPSGIHDDNMYTSVSDTAKIALAAYKMPLFMEMTSTSKYVIPDTNKSQYRNVYNRNSLVRPDSRYFYDDAAGMNAGATSIGGYCVVTTAQRDGLSYLAIVMGADEDEENDVVYSYTEAAKLLDYAFESYANITLVEEGELITEIPVTMSGTTDYVQLVTAGSLTLYLPTSTDIEKEVTRSRKTNSDSLTAPVAEGQVAGVLTVLYNDEIVGNVDLVTTVAVARSDFLYTLEEIKSFATGRFFIAAVISAVVLTVLFVLGKAVYLHNKTKYRGRYS